MADQVVVRQAIVEVCRRLHARNLVAAADGNVSVRLSDEEILITPSGVNKAFIGPRMVSVINLGNHVLSGTPS